jgi:hypothetical protein
MFFRPEESVNIHQLARYRQEHGGFNWRAVDLRRVTLTDRPPFRRRLTSFYTKLHHNDWCRDFETRIAWETERTRIAKQRQTYAEDVERRRKRLNEAKMYGLALKKRD